MRIPWRRRRPPQHRWSPPDPIPDHDRVRMPGQRPWADLLREQAMREPTQPLPTVTAPLMTPAQRWRSRRRHA